MNTSLSRTVTLYTRPGCHLCEEAELLLACLAAEYAWTVVERDVSASPELEARYGLLIPVVQFSDGLELRAPLDESKLRAAANAAGW